MQSSFLKAILYVESEIAPEKHLKKWMQGNASRHGIICQKISEPVTEESIQQAVSTAGVNNIECLVVLATQATWELTQVKNIAGLPYVNPTMDKQFFRNAWIVVEGFEEVDFDFFEKVYQRHHGIPWTIISTERCYLRELSMADMDDLFALYADASATKFVEPLYERAKEEEYQRAYIANMYQYYGYGMWLVCNKESGEIIGRAGLEHRECNNGVELELGYFIVPSQQQKGYATEICQAIIDYAKRELNFPQLNCFIQKENEISIHLAKKLGFHFEEEIQELQKNMCRYVLNIAF